MLFLFFLKKKDNQKKVLIQSGIVKGVGNLNPYLDFIYLFIYFFSFDCFAKKAITVSGTAGKSCSDIAAHKITF